MLRGHKQFGFTIVELLIVVVVIAILAAITLVAYNGISQRATSSAMQSELSQLVKKVETYKITNGTSTYPTDLTTAGVPSSNTGTMSYFYYNSPNNFCAQVIKGNLSYFASSKTKNATPGNCTDFGLLGWWKLNNNGVDSSSNGNTGTLSNTTSATGENGVANNALTFDMATLGMVTIPDSTTLNDSPQTFSFWVKPATWNSPTASVFMAKRSVIGTGYFIAYLYATSTLGFDCGGSSQRWNTGYAPPLNTWTHIVLTCSMEGNLALFVNGVASGTKTGNDRSALTDPVALRLGRDSQTSASYNLNGDLDDVRIYNHALGATEAQLLYSAHSQ